MLCFDGRIMFSETFGSCPMDIQRTKHGLRLSQHGVVISELRTHAGPTHSVFDVLAALIREFTPQGGSSPKPRIGVLGFAGGGMMAPLQALGVSTALHCVDLDLGSYKLFQTHCPQWSAQVLWNHQEAQSWLQQQRHPFDLLVEDLSVPQDGDVTKPAISWDSLPRCIRSMLRPSGVAIFNLLMPPTRKWKRALQKIAAHFGEARILHLHDFENQILIAGDHLPSARALGDAVRRQLRQLRSRQATRLHVRHLTGQRRSAAGGASGDL